MWLDAATQVEKNCVNPVGILKIGKGATQEALSLGTWSSSAAQEVTNHFEHSSVDMRSFVCTKCESRQTSVIHDERSGEYRVCLHPGTIYRAPGGPEYNNALAKKCRPKVPRLYAAVTRRL